VRAAVFVVPGSIETRTGGYEYDRRMRDGLRARGWTIDVRELSAAFPFPSPGDLAQAAAVLRSIPSGATVVVDGLAYGAMPDLAAIEAARLRLIALVHMPLAHDASLAPPTAARLEAFERRALASASRVIVTSRSMPPVLAGYGVSRDRIVVVEPGTDRTPIARGSANPSEVHLVSVASVTRGKGHDLLIEALAAIPQQNWTLTCAGSHDRDPEFVSRLKALIGERGLSRRVSLTGALDGAALNGVYDSADVFVLATLGETYGMAVAEALARGLPVVSTTTGAIPDLVGTDGGLLVPPGDVPALASALTAMLADARLRIRLAAGARAVRGRLPTWDDAAGKMSAALDG